MKGTRRCKDTRTRAPDEYVQCTICQQRLPGDRFYPRHLSCIACQISVNALQRCGAGADRHTAKSAYSRMCEVYFADMEAEVPHIRDRVQAEAVKLLTEDESQGSNFSKRRKVEMSETLRKPSGQGRAAPSGGPGCLTIASGRRRTSSTSADRSSRMVQLLPPKPHPSELDKLAALCSMLLQEDYGQCTGQRA
eukprot:jgi/Ulvmu1/7967/UM004_0200.1